MDKNKYEEQIALAESTINGGFFSNMLTFRTKRLENGLDIYYKTGNMCKDSKLWKEAGYCFSKCGEIEEELGAEPASQYQSSAFYYSFVDTDKSSMILDKAIDFYLKQKKFELVNNIIILRQEI